MVQEYLSRNTSINANRVPAIFRKIPWTPGRNVDIGGGKYDTATRFLEPLGVRNLIFDPHNRSEQHNRNVVMDVAIYGADTATISNVLNVIKERSNRIEVLKTAKRWAKKTYIGVYEGDKSGTGRETKKGCWQENRVLADYIPEVREVFSNVEIRNGMIIAW